MLQQVVTPFKIANGVNLQPSYYNNGNVTFGWDLMHQYTKIKSLRIEIEPDKVNEGKNWIDEAINEGYSVIATYHKYEALGSDAKSELLDAAGWWVDNFSFLSSGTKDQFTINLMNEFGSHDLRSSRFADMYNVAISTIRQGTDYDGAIIVDLSGYGQEADIAADASRSIVDSNIIFSMHIYPSGWNSVHKRHMDNSDIDTLASTGRPCIIGEFGPDTTSQQTADAVDVAGMVNYASSLGWPVLGWAWNGDGGELNMVSPPWYDNPIADTYEESNYFSGVMSLL